MPEDKAFQHFRFKGIEFLAVPRDQGVHIVDINKNNYGSWFSVESFKEKSKENIDYVLHPLSKMRISVTTYQEEL